MKGGKDSPLINLKMTMTRWVKRSYAASHRIHHEKQ
jgi:hypothetical protein